jgi:hemoglobin-like flavoprotein
MTPEQKSLVQQSWNQVAPIAATAAALFYDRLFKLDPSLRPLFKAADMREQGRKLMQVLAVAVKGLDDLDQLVPAVQALGRRHGTYGVRQEHYDTVGQALLWTLEKGLRDRFTAAVRDAWTQAYHMLATAMKAAQAEAELAPA